MQPSPESAVCLPGGRLAAFTQQRERRISRIWYWAILDRASGGFIAGIPDLGDLAAYGTNEKRAVARVADHAAEYVRALVESGQPVPRPRQASEMPTTLQVFKPKSAGP
jgi:predicted RNase H-like HicB family nuclease